MTLEQFINQFPKQIIYLREVSGRYGLAFECEATLKQSIDNSVLTDKDAWDAVYDALYEWDI